MNKSPYTKPAILSIAPAPAAKSGFNPATHDSITLNSNGSGEYVLFAS